MRHRRTMAGRLLAAAGRALTVSVAAALVLHVCACSDQVYAQSAPPERLAPSPGPPAPLAPAAAPAPAPSPPVEKAVKPPESKPARAAAPEPVLEPARQPTVFRIPDKTRSQSGTGGAALPQAGGLLSSLAALAVVIVCIVGGAYLLRRGMPGLRAGRGGYALQVLGRTMLSPRQMVYIVRCGRRLLVLGSTPDRVHTLTEITDPDEVAELAGRCEQARPTSVTNAFRDIFRQQSREMAAEPAPAPAVEETSSAQGIKDELDSLMDKISDWRQQEKGA